MFQPSPWRADFPAIDALQRQHQTYLDSALPRKNRNSCSMP